MDVRAYLTVLRRNLLLIAACVALVVAVVGLVTYRTTPMYESSARVFVSSSQADTTEAYAGGLLSEQRVAGYVVLVDSSVLAEQVRDWLGVDLTTEELSDMVEARAVQDTGVLELSVRAEDPELARLLAQTYAEELIVLSEEIETPRGREDSPVKATIIDPADLPREAVSPKPTQNLALALLFGLVLGAAAALLRELLDTSIKTPDDFAATTEAPLMGSIILESGSNRGTLVSDLDVQAPRVEAFRVLRTNLSFVDVDQPTKVFVVTSAVQQEGKTSTAVNLALSLAQTGAKVLLVDADLRRPRIGEVLGLDDAIGVTTVLLGRVGLDEAVQRHALTELDVLTSGVTPPNAAELLQSKAMASLLEQLRKRYDVVIIDSPPLLPVTDAALIAAQVDGALMVLRYGRTTRDQLATAADRLSQVDAPLVGVVFNMVPASKSVVGYSYATYGSYRSDRSVRNSRGPRRRGRAA